MQHESVVEFASQVIEVHGRKAEREASRQAALCEKYGKAQTAEAWRLINEEIGRQRREALN